MRLFLKLLIPLGFGLFLSGSLFRDLKYSALDMGDPASQLESARQLAQNWGWTEKPAQIPPPFITQSTPKPLFNLMLAGGLKMGFSPSAAYYHGVIRFFALGFFLFSVLTVFRNFGFLCAFLYGGFFVSSNTLLAHILHGGHIWAGLFFLWIALFWITARREAGAAEIAGILILLILACLSSHYMFPFAAMLMVIYAADQVLNAWKIRGGVESFQELAKKAVPAGAVLGLALFFAQVSGYFKLLWVNAKQAAAVSVLYPQGHDFLANLLIYNEGLIYCVLLFFLACGGFIFLLRNFFLRPWPAGIFVLLPLVILLYFERPGSLKLGRLYVTLLPFFMIWASAGASQMAAKLDVRLVWAGALILSSFSWAATKDLRAETRRGFYAGREIERILEERYAAKPENLAVLGLQTPANYLRETSAIQRFNSTAQLAQLALEGKKAVLVSRFSNWNWLGFMDEQDSRVLPVQNVYRSPHPYTAVPSIEALPFYLFANEGIYFQWTKNKILGERENRLYRLEDFISAAGSR